MKKYTILLSCIFLLGCQHKEMATTKKGQDMEILLKMKGYIADEPKEVIVIHQNGKCNWSFWNESQKKWIEKQIEMIPEDILIKIKQKGVKSKYIKFENNVPTYHYQIANSISPHPEGIGELLGFLWTNSNK